MKNIKTNCQQLTKSERILKNFIARPGYVLTSADFVSAEPRVQAVFSNDPMMWELYGTGKKHDIYLFNGKAIEPDPKIRAALIECYDNEGAAEAKKRFAERRQKLYKGWTLSSAYGAGAGKWQMQAEKAGIKLDLETVQQSHTALKEYYSGMQQWGRTLMREWRFNKGWIATGLGRPRAMCWDLAKKDLINAFTQSTAHDVLLWYVAILDKLVKEKGLDAYPLIDDVHDDSLWEVKEEQADEMVATLKEACNILNDRLQWKLPMIIDPLVGKNVWEFKCD